MLEAKVSIMRNSINFTLVNNRESVMFGRKNSGKDLGFNEFQDYDDFYLDSYDDEDDEIANELFRNIMSPSE